MFNSSASCGVGLVCDTRGTPSHAIVSMGLEAAANLTHRGAVSADGKSGDGAGILTQLPRLFLERKMTSLGYAVPKPGDLAAGFLFLYDNAETRIEETISRFNVQPIGWRDVPVNEESLGSMALRSKPRIRQLLIDTAGTAEAGKEPLLYLVRRAVEKELGRSVYVCSLSSRTMVYKGMVTARHLAACYPDLSDESFESAFCIFHERFSTNTAPDWTLAQPFRVLAHNGEINTLQGNRNAMAALEHEVRHEVFGEQERFCSGPLIGSRTKATLPRSTGSWNCSSCPGYTPEHADDDLHSAGMGALRF